MSGIKTTMGEGGRVVIPAEFRKSMGIKPGDEIIVSLEDGEVRISTLAQVIKRAQELVRMYVPDDVSLVDELIEERRREAARE